MARLTEEQIKQAFAPHLETGETLRHWAVGFKQPSMLVILPLYMLALLPGLIAVVMLTKNYLVGLTDRRFVVLRVKSLSNAELKEITEYGLDELRNDSVKTNTGVLFTHIKIAHPDKPFIGKFHRAFSKGNRAHAMAIAEAISPGGRATPTRPLTIVRSVPVKRPGRSAPNADANGRPRGGSAARAGS